MGHQTSRTSASNAVIAPLPSDLTDEQLAAAPVLASIDALLIEELSEDEDEAFAAALDS